MKPAWLLDLEQKYPLGRGTRWTDAELNDLKGELNRNGLSVISDAIGSLQFDKLDLENSLRKLRRPVKEE